MSSVSTQEPAAAVYTRLDALHDYKFQLDEKKLELDQQRVRRELDRKSSQFADERRVAEERSQRVLREMKERLEKNRVEVEDRVRGDLRAQGDRVAEQRERIVEQQIDCEKRLAEQEIRSMEAWVKTLAPNP